MENSYQSPSYGERNEGLHGNGHSADGRSFVSRLKEQASHRVDEQKYRATEKVSHLANALRESSGQLRNSEFGVLADYLEQGIGQVQRFADRMRDKPAAEIVQDIQRFGRQHPAALLAGSFAFGLALARFLKSSNEPQYRSSGSPASGYDYQSLQRERSVSTSPDWRSTSPAADAGSLGTTGSSLGNTSGSVGVTPPASGDLGTTGTTGDFGSIGTVGGSRKIGETDV